MADLELRRLMREVKDAQHSIAGFADGQPPHEAPPDRVRRAAEARLGDALAALQAYEHRAQQWPPERIADDSKSIGGPDGV